MMNVLYTHKDVRIYCKESTLHRVGICIWLHLAISGYIWVHLGASGCIWVHLGAFGCIWVVLVQSDCKEVYVFACRLLVWHDVRMYVCMYTCNHQQPTNHHQSIHKDICLTLSHSQELSNRKGNHMVVLAA